MNAEYQHQLTPVVVCQEQRKQCKEKEEKRLESCGNYNFSVLSTPVSIFFQLSQAILILLLRPTLVLSFVEAIFQKVNNKK